MRGILLAIITAFACNLSPCAAQDALGDGSLNGNSISPARAHLDFEKADFEKANVGAGQTAAVPSKVPTMEEVVVSTPVYQPSTEAFRPQLGTYTYEVSWQGIPAAEGTIALEQEGLYLKLKATARTYSAIDFFYRLRYLAEGMVSLVDFTPVSTSMTLRENSKEKLTTIRFHPDGTIEGQRETVGKNITPFKFNPNNFTLDPFSAAMIARALPWEVGKSFVFDAFNGKSRYLLTLKADAKETIEVNRVERPVWLIKPTVENLVNPAQSKKLREARIYLTADDSREVLKIESEVFVGTVRTKLVSFSPSSSPIQSYRASYLQGDVNLN